MKPIITLFCGAALLGLLTSAQAEEGSKHSKKRPEHSEAQKKIRQEMLTKYDANKDGKLDREERQSISREDREKLRDAGVGPHGGRPEKGKAKERK